ncbi:MAG: dihydroorotase family protein [Proteobacteria bacterium]|nr:dihydroorotase family protein [Pseudomonadota bacterium]
MDLDCVVRGGTAVFPERKPCRADIAIRDGRIVGLLSPGEETPTAREVIDASGKHVFPGCMDAHLHFGFAEPNEEYRTETASAAVGGMSTVISYFLNSESYAGVFEERLAECRKRAHVDFAFHFSTAADVHLEEFPSLVEDCGVTSFKYYMNFKGEEGRYMGLSGTDEGFMYDLLAKAAEFADAVVAIHPENIEVVNRMRRRAMGTGVDSLRAFCEAKPAFTEWENMIRAMVFAEHLGATIYFVHVSSARGVAEVRRFRERYDRIHLETCPHYLTHTMDSKLGSVAKANPPLRGEEDVEALWEAIADGTVDVVGSDHVPRKRAAKEKNIWQASQGFPGVATILPVLLSEGHHKRGLSLRRIAQLVSKRPAEIFRIDRRKGFLGVGADADLTLVDLDLAKPCRWQDLLSHADYTPYDGWTFKGWPVMTIVRGRVVMKEGRMVGDPGYGEYLRRPLK